MTALLMAGALQGDPRLTQKMLPAGWRIEQEGQAGRKDIQAFEERLDGQIKSIWNQTVSCGIARIQLNTLVTAGNQHADRIMDNLQQWGSRMVARRGTVIYEFAKGPPIMAKRLQEFLGLVDRREVVYDVNFRVACVDKLDYMEANTVFNLFLQLEQTPRSEVLQREIAELTRDWTFGTSLRLWTGTRDYRRATFECTPRPVRSAEQNGITTYTFEKLPDREGIPYVDVRATVRVKACYQPAGAEAPKGMTESTPAWPTDLKGVRDIAAKFSEKAVRERAAAVHGHVTDNILFGGSTTGSRYGIERVLRQGFGHCWDISDVFVTLCRASGLPARQVAGWIPALNAGHVWAEVYVEGAGWLPVDASVPWLGTTDDYVSLFASDDGEMPIVYLSRPVINSVK